MLRSLSSRAVLIDMPSASHTRLPRSNAIATGPTGAVAAPEAGRQTALIDPARERRVKALTCTEPLHTLQAGRSRRGWDRFDFYDLGLAAIDYVVDRMGFDTGISRQELDGILLFEARRFSRQATDDELAAVTTEL